MNVLMFVDSKGEEGGQLVGVQTISPSFRSRVLLRSENAG
jgi:hypothetical protein